MDKNYTSIVANIFQYIKVNMLQNKKLSYH